MPRQRGSAAHWLLLLNHTVRPWDLGPVGRFTTAREGYALQNHGKPALGASQLFLVSICSQLSPIALSHLFPFLDCFFGLIRVFHIRNSPLRSRPGGTFGITGETGGSNSSSRRLQNVIDGPVDVCAEVPPLLGGPSCGKSTGI